MAGEKTSPPAEDRVDAINPRGELVTIPRAQVEAALGRGYKLDTPELQRERQLEAQYADRPLESGALGVLRGATLGASDWALRETGLYEADELKQLQQRNEAASTVGEVGSLLLPTGAAGLVGRAGRAAAGVVRGTSATSRMAAGALRGAVEGSLFGAGAALTEEALDGEPGLNGEKLAAGALKGALLGGPLGGVLAGAEYGLGRAMRHLNERAGRRVEEATQRANAMAAERAADETASAIGVAGGETVRAANIAKTLQIIDDLPTTSRNPDAYADMLERAAEAAAGRSESLRNRIAAQASPQVGRQVESEFASRAAGVVRAQRAGPQADMFEAAAARLREGAARVRETGQVPPNMLREIRDGMLASPEYASLVENTLHNMAADLPHEVARSRAAREAARVAADTEGQRAAQYANEMLDTGAFLRGPVMDRVRRYGVPGVASLAGGYIGSEVGGPAGAIVGQAIGALGGAGLRPMARSIARAAEHPVFQRAFWGAVQRVTESAPERLGAYATTVATAASRGPAVLWATHTALASKDPEYREAMALAGFPEETPEQLQDVEKRVGQLQRVEDAITAHDSQVDKAIGRFLGQQGGAKPQVKRDTRPRGERLEDLKGKVERLAELAARPEAVIERLQPGETLTSAAPATGAAAVATATRALQFLHQQAPKNPNASPIPALQDSWRPTDGDLARWERYVEAVETPYAVLHRLRDGAIHPDSVQALQAVYPALLEDTRRRMMERLSAYEGKLSYKQKLALSTLMGQPMGTAGDAAKLRVLQDAHAAAQTARAQQKAAAVKAPSNMQTLSQRVEAR